MSAEKFGESSTKLNKLKMLKMNGLFSQLQPHGRKIIGKTTVVFMYFFKLRVD